MTVVGYLCFSIYCKILKFKKYAYVCVIYILILKSIARKLLAYLRISAECGLNDYRKT